MYTTWPSSWCVSNAQCTVILVLLVLLFQGFPGIYLWLPVLKSGSPSTFFGKDEKGFLVFVLGRWLRCLWAILHKVCLVQTGKMSYQSNCSDGGIGHRRASQMWWHLSASGRMKSSSGRPGEKLWESGSLFVIWEVKELLSKKKKKELLSHKRQEGPMAKDVDSERGLGLTLALPPRFWENNDHNHHHHESN